jgi:WD40 repeat protein/DNA-binding SARP family transcriptional activator
MDGRGGAVSVQFTVAGALRLAHDGARIEERAFGGPQPRLVSAMLLVDRDRAWSPEQLADQLWPSGPPHRWRPAVRGLVSRLRGLLAEVGVDSEAVTSRSGHYHVELPDMSVDLDVARDEVRRAARALADGRYAVADGLAGRARAVLSRPILTGIDAPWVEELRHLVAPDHVESLLLLGRARRGQERWAGARSVLAEVLARVPFREDAWRDLMELEAASGNTATALRVYEDCRRRLADELGVDPSPTTQALHTAILRGVPVGTETPVGWLTTSSRQDRPADPGTARSEAAGDDVPSPYVGLRSFEQADADRFFGRDAEVQRLVDLLGEHGAVTVVGPSGSGKSSLVRAGLLPALAHGAIPDADTWPVVVAVPGRQPLRALADALVGIARGSDRSAAVANLVGRLAEDPGVLHVEASRALAAPGADPGARVVLVVDQAEELFTVADPTQAAAMLAAVAAAVRRRARRVAVIVTMRADFYAPATSNPDMAALLGRSQLVISPMSGAELEAAVVGPAGLAGVTLERGIVGRLVDDATGQPGRLPLLQHTLWQLWHHRDGSALTVEGYDRIGGLAGALAHHAEQTFQSVGDQALARRILLRGVSPGNREVADSRRPIHRADLDGSADTKALHAVLEHLVSNRLLQAEARDDGVVFELAHEALITGWPRLQAWVTEQRNHLVVARAVGVAADRWEAAERDPDWLLRGRMLADAVSLLEAVDGEELDLALSPAEVKLVAASRAAAARQRAQRRVERVLAAGRLSLADDPELSLLLGLEVIDDVRDRVPGRRQEVASLLRRGIHRHRLVRRGRDVGVLLTVSPDGRLVAVAGRPPPGPAGGGSSSISLHRVHDGERVAVLSGHDPGSVPRAAFSPDGTYLVSGDGAGVIRTWNIVSGGLEQCWAGPDGPVGGLDVAAGSGLVAAWAAIGHDRQLVVCTPDGTRVHETPPDGTAAFEDDLPRPGRLVAFHPDGSRLLSATADVARRIDLIDVATWQVLASTTQGRMRTSTMNVYYEVTSLEWSHDGSDVAVAVGATTQILDGSTLDRVRTVSSDTRSSVSWTSDGGRVVTAGSTLSFLERHDPDPVSDTPTPPVVIRPTSASLDRLRVRAVPDSAHVLLGNERTGAVDLHDVSTYGPGEVANLAPMGARGVAWSPDGQHLALGRGDGLLGIVETAAWQEVDRYQAHSHEGERAWPRLDGPIRWSPDGRFIASVASDGTLTIRHLSDGTSVTVQVGQASNWPGDCDIAADSRHVAAVVRGTAMIVRTDGTGVATLDVPTEHLGCSRLSADGTVLAIPHRGGRGRTMTETWTTLLWDWRSDEPPGKLGPDGAVYGRCVSFHPDGGTVAFSADDEIVRIVDPVDGSVLQELRGHAVEIHDVAHHPTGRLLASSGWDRTVRVWDLTTCAPIAVFDVLTGQPGAMAFHPSRPWLAVADWSGVVRVWTLDFDELVQITGDRVTRELTDAERLVLQD